ncbi:MAG: DegV family EDD domain-containing protein, partial [Oscillospiraceae bacterium]|nr:DegV family EDD domain-containing protein [Oscillospiraceae bacterium]
MVAETGADIPPETAQRYGIHIVPMHVSFGSVTRDDGTFPSEEICTYYQSTKQLPKTSGSTPEDFTRVFDDIHSRWPETHILYLAYSSVTTCSYQSAQIAAESRDYVASLDTKAVSAGQHSIVVRMAQLLEKHPEWDMSQAVVAAENLISRSRMCFIPNELEFLRAGGRVSNAAAVCGKLLGIHPLIEIQDGFLVATKKLRGKLEKIAPKLVEEYAAANNLEREE